jgi:hypothetical protein
MRQTQTPKIVKASRTLASNRRHTLNRKGVGNDPAGLLVDDTKGRGDGNRTVNYCPLAVRDVVSIFAKIVQRLPERLRQRGIDEIQVVPSHHVLKHAELGSSVHGSEHSAIIKGQAASAKIAKIPFDLAYHIAKVYLP